MSDAGAATDPDHAREAPGPFGVHAPQDRAFLSVVGSDAETFLQGLLTNDVAPASVTKAVYAALLTPQGKFLVDMLIWRPAPDRFLLDVAAPLAPDLRKRLTLYKLRAAVEVAPAPELGALLLWGDGAEDAAGRLGDEALALGPDPRAPQLGWRLAAPQDAIALWLAALTPDADPAAAAATWERRRIAFGVPEAGLDLRPNDAFVLEYGFERLAGVDFKKGCFVGQEIVARMKHKATLKKGLYRLTLEGPAPEAGAEILAEGKPAGTVGSVRDGTALGLLRIDRAGSPALTVGGARILTAAPASPAADSPLEDT